MSERERLSRNLRWTIRIAFSVGALSLWPFYDQYWRWRGLFIQGNYIDPSGQARYEEAAVWGVMVLISLAAGLLAICVRWRRDRVDKGPLGGRK